MSSLNIARDDNNGDFCLEAWKDNKKVTIWVNKDGTFHCFISKDKDIQEANSPYEALNWFGDM